MKPRPTIPTALLPSAVLALVAVIVVVIGAAALHRQLRNDIHERALTSGRQLAFGVGRSGSEAFWRFREEFTFSLTHLPYERLLAEQDAAPETLVPVRRFLALNQDILRELVVIGTDGRGRIIRMTGENYFTFTPLDRLREPVSGTDTAVISGVVQSPDGAIRARVSAVIDPVRFWRATLTSFSLSHPDVWIHLIDQEGRSILVRHGGRQIASPPIFETEVMRRLRDDAVEGYEGRLAHPVKIAEESTTFISVYLPLRLENWQGQIVVSSDEHDVIGPAGKALGILAAMAGLLVVLLLALFYLVTRQNLRTQREIEEARRRIEAILNTVQSGILLVHEPSGRIVETNSAALRLIGRPADQVVKHALDEFIEPVADRVGPGHTRFPIATDSEARLRDHAGRLHTVLANSHRLEFGGTHYRLCSFVDITALRETTDRLLNSQASLQETNARLQDAIHAAERSAREAETANRSKSAFLAMMSHELRTPLNSILGLSESLMERIHGPLTERQSRYLDLIVSSGRHLLELINDILDLAKIESGREEVNLVPCCLREVCEAGLHVVQPMAARRRQTLERVLPHESVRIRAEPRRMRQILVNLLGNAVKFTPEGGQLGLRCEVLGEEARIAIWDRGIGIAPDQLPRLFQPFVQVDNRLSRDYGGTGLGLALVKQLVAIHGGRIEVASEPGQGSTFTVVLPVYAEPPLSAAADTPATAAAPAAAAEIIEEPLILIAEDTSTNVVAVKDFLEAKGCRVEIAENGRVAVEKTAALRPAAVLMDIQMPVMDGLEATRAIRTHPDPLVSRIPVIALTALAMHGDRERCLSAGADDYVTKPVSPRVVYERLITLLAPGQVPTRA